MGERIKINCKKVYDNGVNYLNESDEIKSIQNELDSISAEIEKIWGGEDGHNFIVTFNEHIKSFDAIINFLGENGNLLKNQALEHSGIDNTLATQVERSDMDE